MTVMLTEKDMEIYTDLISAMEAARDNLTTRFDNLQKELQKRAEHAAAQRDAYEGDDDAVWESLDNVESSICHALEEDLGWLDVNIAGAFCEWQDKLKSAFAL
jgi:hypothetical protein